MNNELAMNQAIQDLEDASNVLRERIRATVDSIANNPPCDCSCHSEHNIEDEATDPLSSGDEATDPLSSGDNTDSEATY